MRAGVEPKVIYLLEPRCLMQCLSPSALNARSGNQEKPKPTTYSTVRGYVTVDPCGNYTPHHWPISGIMIRCRTDIEFSLIWTVQICRSGLYDPCWCCTWFRGVCGRSDCRTLICFFQNGNLNSLTISIRRCDGTLTLEQRSEAHCL